MSKAAAAAARNTCARRTGASEMFRTSVPLDEFVRPKEALVVLSAALFVVLSAAKDLHQLLLVLQFDARAT